jgi:peptidoglycan hydrolase-like protein with peptidoglycan-binding domain
MTKVLAAVLAAGLACALAPASRAAGPQAAGLQVALRAWGFYDGPVDAVAGPSTRAAVRAFQQREGLPVDGIAGRETRRALGPLGRPLRPRRLLEPGAFGWDVSVLQFGLTRAGVYHWPADGYFGKATAAGVRRYQRAHGLTPDGVAGPQTLALLRGAAAAPEPTQVALAPAPRTSYVVRPGDTLTGIAGKLGTTLPALAHANKLDPSQVLLIGMELHVPSLAEPAASEVRNLVDSWAGRYGVDPALARAVAWMESGYQTNLTSPAGAWGVMQIIPSAWDYVEQVVLGQPVKRSADGNVQVGVALLGQLLREFHGDERLAVAAFYQGAKAVREHGLYDETKTYVADVLALRSRV